MRKYYFSIVFIIAYVVGAYSQSTSNTFKIVGNVSKPGNGVIYLSYSYNNQLKVDSCSIVNRNFQFTGKLSQPVVAYLRPTNSRVIDSNAVFVFLEPGILNIKLNLTPFAALKIEGSKTHDDYLTWKAANDELKKKFENVLEKKDRLKSLADNSSYSDSLNIYYLRKKQVGYNFIKSHPKSYASAYHLLFTYRDYSKAELKEVYDNLGSDLQASTYGAALFKNISKMENASEGDMAKDFTANDFMTEKSFNLLSYRGKYVIMDFWGSWCKPCIALIPSIVKEHGKYKDRNIDFVSIAYDHKKNMPDCKEIIKNYGINWINLLDDQDSQDRKGLIVNKYDIHVFPTIVVINPDGKIIYKGEGDDGFLKAKNLLEHLF